MFFARTRSKRPSNLSRYARQTAQQNSMFGQMKRNTVNWGDSAWRRSYVDIQDAGQERAFFVQFTGEGVDDHGGP